ncbi:MAG: XRE family transcriptional regulator [Chloroflexi bacterium]|nr:XRE family transcriptional regulator [Chloroflexota bacterium]
MANLSVAELLRQHRQSRGLTQVELAERAGLSWRGISDLERGLKQAPRASTVRLLARGLGLSEPEAAALLRAARPGQAPDANERPGCVHHNLPLSATSFVPREGEIGSVEHVLRESSLVTLTGAGGCGKTRLALEVAWKRLDDFPDGVWFVELASLVDTSLVTQTIAATLGIPSTGRPPDEVLTEFLRNKEALLLLDNCEQVIEATALLVERLLRSCSDVRVLATSRERLDLPGEAVHRVAGLAVPSEGALGEEVARSEAGQLFLERARRLVPDLRLDADGAASVVRICRRLDGIPLALELAATAARALSLEDLAIRLDDRFRLLRDAGRTAPPRHQTLRATMDWSYWLLDAVEVTLFRQLAVFAGGFDLAAVEAVHGTDALPVLLRLIDKSLVVVDRRGRTQRYRMLEIVRQYAEEKLADSGEAAVVRARQRDYYLGLAEDAVAGLRGPDQVAWVERLDLEHDNLRAALAWCQMDAEGADAEERLAGALGRFWRDRGHNREGFEWLTHAAARRPGVISVGRGRALQWAAIIGQHGDFAKGQQAALLEDSVSILRQAGDPVELSLALRHLWSNRSYGPHAEMQADVGLLEESVGIARAAGDRRETGWGLLYLAQAALTRTDVAEARRLADEALQILRGLDPNSLLNALLLLGRVALAQGEHTRAESVFHEMIDQSHAIGDRVWLSDAWLGLAGAVAGRGDVAGARSCFRALVGELRAATFSYVLPRVLLALAMFEAGRGHDLAAARLFGAFEAANSAPTGWPLEGFCLGPDLKTLQGRLLDVAFAEALAAGRRLTVDQALDEAVESVGAPAETLDEPGGGPASAPFAPLR